MSPLSDATAIGAAGPVEPQTPFPVRCQMSTASWFVSLPMAVRRTSSCWPSPSRSAARAA